MARSLLLLIRRELNSWTPSSLSVSTGQFSPWNQKCITFWWINIVHTKDCQWLNIILLETDTSKATGPDGISGRMLKGTAQSIAISLCKLFNMSISTGSIPQEWRTSNIVPVHKSASKGLASNYRPISLLCIVSKLLERHKYVLQKMEGFSLLHSGGSALTRPTHHWLRTLESRSSICSVFFDIKKRLWHSTTPSSARKDWRNWFPPSYGYGAILSAAENSNQWLHFIYWCSAVWSSTVVHPQSPFVSAIYQWCLRGSIKFHYRGYQ